MTSPRKLALGAWLLLAGCRHGAADPGQALAGFASAVEKKDYASAYARMSEEYRARVSLDDFRSQVESGGLDTTATARRLREGAPRAELHTDIEMDLGETVPMVLEAGAWRIDGPPIDYYSQATPRAALRAFVRALERKRWDVVLRLVPARHRGEVTADKLREYWQGERAADNEALLAALRAHVGDRIVEEGDEAHMPYGTKAEVRFVREDGVWKIDRPE